MVTLDCKIRLLLKQVQCGEISINEAMYESIGLLSQSVSCMLNDRWSDTGGGLHCMMEAGERYRLENSDGLVGVLWGAISCPMPRSQCGGVLGGGIVG